MKKLLLFPVKIPGLIRCWIRAKSRKCLKRVLFRVQKHWDQSRCRNALDITGIDRLFILDFERTAVHDFRFHSKFRNPAESWRRKLDRCRIRETRIAIRFIFEYSFGVNKIIIVSVKNPNVRCLSLSDFYVVMVQWNGQLRASAYSTLKQKKAVVQHLFCFCFDKDRFLHLYKYLIWSSACGLFWPTSLDCLEKGWFTVKPMWAVSSFLLFSAVAR